MSFAPFLLTTGNGSDDPETFKSYSGNAGVSMGFNFPLDGSLTELCKARARTEIARQQAEADKARLDFELVRQSRMELVSIQNLHTQKFVQM